MRNRNLFPRINVCRNGYLSMFHSLWLRRRNTKHKHAQKLNKKKKGDKHKEEEKPDTNKS